MSAGPRRAILGMGSNLGDRVRHLRMAVAALAGIDVAVSDVYETAPVGGPEQGPFLNLVVAFDTDRTGRELLELAQRLETAAERVRRERWGPRTLDVDVLWIDGETLDEPDLVVPHPRLFTRDFVLAPLADVAPDLVPDGWAASADVVRLGPLAGDLPSAPPGARGFVDPVDQRRRVVDLALDLSPDLYLDQLVTALADAGVGDVAEDVLIADLQALGYDVDPDDVAVDDGDPAAGQPLAALDDPGPSGDVSSTAAEVDLVIVDAFADDLGIGPRARPGASPDPEDDEPRPLFGVDRSIVLAMAVALVAVILAFSISAIAGDDDPSTGAGEGDTGRATGGLGAGSQPAETTVPPTATTVPPTATTVPPDAPAGPGADPALADGGDAATSFDEDQDGLPDLSADLAWQVDTGSWVVQDQRVVGSSDGSGALATVDLGTRDDVRAEVALSDAVDGAGLAFAIEDDDTYMLWAPAPGFPTIALFRVDGDQIDFVLNAGVTNTGPGGRVGIHIAASEVELLVAGAVVATYSDESESTQVGLAVAPGNLLGTFDDLVVATGP